MIDDPTQSIRENYDVLADEYARQLFNEIERKPRDQEMLKRFASEVEGRGEVCDMGCGPGQVARRLRDLGVDVSGLDLSERMVEQAHRLNPDISFRQGNMMALDLPNDSLAGIVAFYAIVNIPKGSLHLVFREMQRVLQPSGLLLLTFHCGDEIVHRDELWGVRISMDFLLFQPAAIRLELEDAGLVVEEIIERQPYAPDVEFQSRRAYIFARKPRLKFGTIPE